MIPKLDDRSKKRESRARGEWHRDVFQIVASPKPATGACGVRLYHAPRGAGALATVILRDAGGNYATVRVEQDEDSKPIFSFARRPPLHEAGRLVAEAWSAYLDACAQAARVERAA